MTSSPDLAALLVQVEASETRMRGLRVGGNGGQWGEGYAQGAAEAYGVVAAMLRALLALAGDTSGGGGEIDNSSVARADVAASSGVKSDSREGH